MSELACPQCSTPAAEGAQFCEECGSALSAAIAKGGDPALRCPECGAGPTALDAEGFCTQCGHRRLRSKRDHFEDAISPRAAGVSDIGCRYSENQDYFVLGKSPDDELVAIVCDGVSRSQSSMQGSKVAGDAALALIDKELAEPGLLPDPDATLKRAMSVAQEAICTVPFTAGLMDDGDPLPPAQATIVGVLVVGKRITLGWLGDSRAYWVGKHVRQLTTDHSWLNDVVNAGEMTVEEAKKDPRARAIVRSLGADLDGKNPGVEPDAVSLNVTEDGTLLVVSDGFYTYADDAKIAELVREKRGTDALTLARHLVEHARSCGGSDNITVVAISF